MKFLTKGKPTQCLSQPLFSHLQSPIISIIPKNLAWGPIYLQALNPWLCFIIYLIFGIPNLTIFFKGNCQKTISSIHCVLNMIKQVLSFPCFWSTVEAQWSTPIRKVTSQRKDWTHCVNDMITDQVLYVIVSSFICWEKLEFLLCQTAMGINQVHILKLSWHCSLLCLLRFN